MSRSQGNTPPSNPPSPNPPDLRTNLIPGPGQTSAPSNAGSAATTTSAPPSATTSAAVASTSTSAKGSHTKTSGKSSSGAASSRKPPPISAKPRRLPAQSAPYSAPAPAPPVQQHQQPPYPYPHIAYQHPPPPPPPPSSAAKMNPPFPVNGGPYAHPHPPPAPYHPSPSPHNGVGHPPPPPYGYHPMQPYPHHQYHPYPNYPMMGYSSSPPPPPPQHVPPPAPQTPSSASMAKRKRKGTADSSKAKSADRASDAEDSPVDTHKKRTKTQRACDSCRSRKIRCDVLPDTEPPVCQHCKQYGFECTFFLPITETRFKKKRLEEEAAAAAVQSDKDKTVEPQSPKPDTSRNVRIDGPTSMTHLLHSTATVPSRAYHSYDQRYHHTWEVSKAGDGLIQVLEPNSDDPPSVLPKPIDLKVERDVIEKLINSYFTDVAPLVPIVTQSEFLALSDPSPPPILLYSLCLVAACKRDVPQAIFDSLRVAVNDVIKSEDVLSTANIVNVQSLLILCQCADVHSQFVPNALSALWIRLGTAIRMAQDLGLHRAEAVKKNIEMRRRVWGACVITDRWISLTYGHPFMIDVEDCDARLPSSGDPNDHYTDELLRLSIILGRVLKTIYSPSGLTYATDSKLYSLLHDMKLWQANLPEDLQFRGPGTSRSGGLLHLLYSAVSMIFWRVFMRISYSCPAHLKFGLTVEQWTDLVNMTGDAIDWLDAHEALYDVWMLVAYAATSCALVQYHTWVRRKDASAQAKLRKLRDCVRRWEASLQPEHMSTRRKTAEIITLLYETTQGPPVTLEDPPALNPTGGVVRKVQADFKGLKYRKDPTRPGGGVFVAHGKAKEGDYSNMPEGTVIINQGVSDEESEGEGSAAEVLSMIHSTNDSAPSSSHPIPSGVHSGPASAGATDIHPGIDTLPPRLRHLMTVASGAGAAATVAGGSPPGSASSMVNYTPLGSSSASGNFANVNPALNVAGPSDVQVLNVLDVPHQPNTLEQFAVADSGLLEGIPGSMFDWPQWENFFSRFSAPADPNALAAYAQAAAHHQQQQRQMEQNAAMNAEQHYQGSSAS